MAVEVGIVGLPGSGKSTLFQALTGLAPESGAYGKPHVGMVSVPDDRLPAVADAAGSPRWTPASIRIVDVPGTGAALLGNLRRADALVAVLDGFSPGADPERDRSLLGLELLVADRDHVEKRLETVRRQAKSGDPALRREVEELESVLAHVEAERALSDYEGALPAELEPLTTKPVVEIVNGPGGLDAALEAELAQLDEEEAAEFREGESALEELARRLATALDLVTFFTANENEARAWHVRRGDTALDAASAIHTDMARGFVRCEVVSWSDLVEAGSRAEAARRGLVRLEGKEYAVADGDVLTIRFTPAR